MRSVPFDARAESNPQYLHSLQFENETVVVTVRLPPHDGVAGTIAQHIMLNVHGMCHPKVGVVQDIHSRHPGPPHLALKFLTTSQNTFKFCSQELGPSYIFTSMW